eukprot:Lankesteria_metandrocarpae@DN8084_c0_g1_i1.p1
MSNFGTSPTQSITVSAAAALSPAAGTTAVSTQTSPLYATLSHTGGTLSHTGGTLSHTGSTPDAFDKFGGGMFAPGDSDNIHDAPFDKFGSEMLVPLQSDNIYNDNAPSSMMVAYGSSSESLSAKLTALADYSEKGGTAANTDSEADWLPPVAVGAVGPIGGDMDGGDGWTAASVFESVFGFTYDDIILMPDHINFDISQIDLTGRISRRISLQTPLASSPMDTVTEHRMAIHLALVGGLGIIHNNLTVEAQMLQVQKVKRYENGFILEPVVLKPTHTIADIDRIKKSHGYSSFPITVDGKMGSELIGIITNRDFDFFQDRSIPIAD